jgi:N-acetylmuramoyl-L-alanine amidase
MNRARKLETQLAASIATSMPGVNVYRQSEDGLRKLPCVVVMVRNTGTDYRVRFSGQYADTLELKVSVTVEATQNGTAEGVEALARSAHDAVEAASGFIGWNHLQIEFAGDESSNSDEGRSHVATWGVIAI